MDASASRQGFSGLEASADGDPLVHFVPAAGGASASSAARAPSEGRGWRRSRDGGDDAALDDKRTDASDAE